MINPKLTTTINPNILWKFDFEITTIAKSVSADQATTVTIAVTAESAPWDEKRTCL